jgi:hypothetical protein
MNFGNTGKRTLDIHNLDRNKFEVAVGVVNLAAKPLLKSQVIA